MATQKTPAMARHSNRRAAITANKLQLEQRNAEISRQLLAGATLAQIAEQTGLSVPRVGEIRGQLIKQWREQSALDIEELVQVELARADAIIAGHFAKATTKGDAKSAEVVLKAIELRMKLLAGLSTTRQVEQILQTDASKRERALALLQPLAIEPPAESADIVDAEVVENADA